MKLGHAAGCGIFATKAKSLAGLALKIKRCVPKLDLHCYEFCVRFVRFANFWNTRGARVGAEMPLTFKPKLDKIVELLLYLAYVRPGADKYQAVKFFYLADREHLRRFGRPITFEDYYALWYGPVASNTLDFLNENHLALRSAGIRALPFRTERGTIRTKSGRDTDTVFIREPDRKVNFDLFSKSDLQVFDEVISKYGNASFDELYEETHSHFAYDNAWRTRRRGDRAAMFYDEMIEDESLRAALLKDLSAAADHMK